jgi:hypothetical protein
MVLSRKFNELERSTMSEHFYSHLIFANKAELGQQGVLHSIEREKICFVKSNT